MVACGTTRLWSCGPLARIAAAPLLPRRRAGALSAMGCSCERVDGANVREGRVSVTMRPYAGEDDYSPLRHLFDVVAGASPLHYGMAGDLDWWRFAHEDPDVLRHAALWCADDDATVGFAWPKGNEVEVESHPAHRDLEGAIFAWAEAQAASQSPPAPLLAARCFDEDASRVATLRGGMCGRNRPTAIVPARSRGS